MARVSYREIAKSFLTLVASGKVREAYTKYVSADFRHHNPYFKGDRESLMKAMEDNAVKTPNKVLEIKMAIEEGNLVTTFSHIRQKPEELGAAVVHIFRFERDHITEMWDLGQAVPKESPNENGMF